MSHDITSIPNYSGRSQWHSAGQTALSRLLVHRKSIEQVSPEFILSALKEGSWMPTQEDISGEVPALLALMGSYVLADTDAGTPGVNDLTIPIMPVAEQEIALFLAERGCAITTRLPEGQGSGDALDMALVLGADLFLDKHIDQVEWEARTMMGLPWLHFAARRGFSSVLKVLIAHGGKVERLDKEGNTPLFHASDASCVEVLLAAGVNASHINKSGKTASSYWESVRGVKGERNKLMSQSLGKAKVNLTKEQEIEQFFLVAKTAPKGRLEKEIRRLKLTGTERNEGVGILQHAANRQRKNLGGSNWGAQVNSDRNWLDFVCSWKGAVSVATTAEVMDAYLVAHLTSTSTAQENCAALIENLPLTKEEKEKAWILAIRRVYADKAPDPTSNKKLISMLCGFEHPMKHAPLMLDLIAREMGGDYHGSHLSEVCDLLSKNMQTAEFNTPQLFNSLIACCLSEEIQQGPIYDVRERLKEMSLDVARKTGKWSPSVRSSISDMKVITSSQTAFLDQLTTTLDANELANSSPCQENAPRRSHRL